MYMVSIRTMRKDDIPLLKNLKEGEEGRAPQQDYYTLSLLQQEIEQKRLVFLAFAKEQGVDMLVGYVHYNRNPQYQPFRSLKIPEIQDLRVGRNWQRQGIGAQLIKHCEMQARQDSHDMIGIAVGLYAAYGSAQRLYARMGYVPDGYGLTYDRVAVTPGEMRPVDDNLCLMMVKTLD